jgi:hypothetical protein
MADPRFREFRKSVERAEAEAEVAKTDVVWQAANKDWHAAAWWLDHRVPEWRLPRGTTTVTRLPEPPNVERNLIVFEAETLERLGINAKPVAGLPASATAQSDAHRRPARRGERVHAVHE